MIISSQYKKYRVRWNPLIQAIIKILYCISLLGYNKIKEFVQRNTSYRYSVEMKKKKEVCGVCVGVGGVYVCVCGGVYAFRYASRYGAET